MREKLYRFMQGRYGTDKLNQFLFYLELILLVLSLFLEKTLNDIRDVGEVEGFECESEKRTTALSMQTEANKLC